MQLRLQRRTSDPDLVADALQDTFVAVWRSAGIVPRRRRRRRLDLGHRDPPADLAAPRPRAATPPLGAEVIEHVSPAVQSAEDQLLVGVEYGDLGAALRSLSPELRTVVQATVIDGLTTKEAARLLGLPQGTVKTRVRAAKAQLRGRLVPANGGL